MQRQPFGLGEVVVDPFQKGLKQMIGPERRSIGEHAPRLGRAGLADNAAAKIRLGSASRLSRKSQQSSAMQRVDIDLIGCQRASYGAVDPGEDKFLNLVGSRPEFDLDGETVTICFEPGQKSALDFATRHGNHRKCGLSAPLRRRRKKG